MKKPTGLCASCFQPGHCCKNIPLSVRWHPDSAPEMVAEWMRDGGYPFEPIVPLQFIEPADENGWRRLLFSCPKLDSKTGRCLIYDSRPEACSSYEPGCDRLCVHFQPQEGTGDGL